MEGWERSGFLNNLGRPGVTDEDQNDPRSWQRSTNLNNRYFEYFPAHQKESSDVETSSVKSKEKRKSWQEAMYDFTQNTTFHGIRYITEKHSMSLRRLIWIILILACSGLMSFQIIDRILFYASWPVTVNVAINFNKTIQFPSVAICNQNAFKITEAHRLGYLELLELLYTKGSREYKLQRIKDLDAGDTKFKDLFLRTRHLREDMIVKCEWDSKPCHASHFVQVLTDHGVCYAFASNTSDPLYITDTGTDHGLRLTINVEQYEYMHGPHDSAGLKILLYDPMEEPLVYELGQAVATGTHTYVGVKVIQMKYLTAPYGNCTDDKKLKYYTYSETACKLECMRDFYADKCNCTLLHMAKSASTPICTIGQYHDCILKAKGDILHPGEANERNKDDFNAQTVEPCDCPQPCEVPMYEPNFSYSTTSNFDVDNLLTMVNTTDLLSRYIKARDTAHSVEMKYFKVDKTVIEDCIKAFDDIRTLIHEEFPAVIEDHLKKLETIEKKLATERRRKGFTNFYQKYIVRKNFVRGVTSMDEKTWSSVASDYFTFAYHYDHQIRLLADGKKTDIREMYRELLDISIGARRELTQNALSNITTAEIGYRDGVNLLNYRLGKEPLEETIAAIPKTLLNKVVTRVGQLSWYYLTRFKSDLQDLTQDYDQMHYFVTKTYDDRRLNEGRLREILGNFTTHSRKFLGARSNVLDEVFKKPLVKLEEKDEKWNKKIEELSKVLQEMKVNLKNLLERCKDIRESAWINSSVAVDHAREYLEDQSHGKTVLGQIITDSSLQEAVTKIDIFFREIRTRSQGLHDNYDRFLEVVLDIWDFIFDDPDALNYYKYKKFAWATMDLGELRESTITSYKAIRYDHDLIRMVKSRDHLFTSSMGKMMNLFKDYMAGNQLDANFYRQNFLQMDVFYRKLSYELIEQQQAYDVFGLLCDIGGSMGLFIGASALTIFELLDVFAYVIFRKAEPKPIRGSKFRNTR